MNKYIVFVVDFNNLQEKLCNEADKGYRIVHMNSEMYQGTSIYNVVMEYHLEFDRVSYVEPTPMPSSGEETFGDKNKRIKETTGMNICDHCGQYSKICKC